MVASGLEHYSGFDPNWNVKTGRFRERVRDSAQRPKTPTERCGSGSEVDGAVDAVWSGGGVTSVVRWLPAVFLLTCGLPLVTEYCAGVADISLVTGRCVGLGGVAVVTGALRW